jgi:hypothetical protein
MAVEQISSYGLWEYPASADLSTKQYYCMVLSSGQLATAGANVSVTGILQDKPNAAGVSGTIAVAGISKAVAGAAITQDALVTCDAAGKVVTAATTATTIHHIVGRALVAAAADGDVISVLLAAPNRDSKS